MVWKTPAVRAQGRAIPLVLVGAVMLASCGADQAVSPPDPTVAIVDGDADPSTTVTSSGDDPSDAATSVANSALEPFVVCVDELEAVAWFGYRNDAYLPLAAPGGPGNRLDGGDPLDAPRVPELFGTGQVEPAFMARFTTVDADTATDGDPWSWEPITWTLVGPDGVERSAVATIDGPVCDPGEISFDDRRVELALVDVTVSDALDVDVLVELTGDVALSVCAPGLEPLAPLILIEPDGEELRPGPAASIAVPLAGEDLVATRLSIAGWLVDQCTADGAVSGSWPILDPRRPEMSDVDWCVAMTPSGPRVQQSEPWDCPPGLPLSPGVRTRPG